MSQIVIFVWAGNNFWN